MSPYYMPDNIAHGAAIPLGMAVMHAGGKRITGFTKSLLNSQRELHRMINIALRPAGMSVVQEL
jgi:hypothetical protein